MVIGLAYLQPRKESIHCSHMCIAIARALREPPGLRSAEGMRRWAWLQPALVSAAAVLPGGLRVAAVLAQPVITASSGLWEPLCPARHPSRAAKAAGGAAPHSWEISIPRAAGCSPVGMCGHPERRLRDFTGRMKLCGHLIWAGFCLTSLPYRSTNSTGFPQLCHILWSGCGCIT